jgi:hypothetical protein
MTKTGIPIMTLTMGYIRHLENRKEPRLFAARLRMGAGGATIADSAFTDFFGILVLKHPSWSPSGLVI